MGNITSSAATDRQQSAPFSMARDTASVVPGGRGRDREQSAPSSSEPSKSAVARYIAPQSTSTPQSRIVVDIRSANLDRDYNVYIKQEPRRDIDVTSAWSGIQALGALCITVLTIQKLWEDIKFIRLLRRELSTLVGSLTDAAGGDLDTGDGNGAASRPPAARPGESSGRSKPSAAPSPSPSTPQGPAMAAAAAARQLDAHLNELSEKLNGCGGGRGRGRGTAAAAVARDQGPAAAAAAEAVADPAGVAAGRGAGEGGKGGRGAAATHKGGKPQLQTNNHNQQGEASAATVLTVNRKETTWASISGLMEVKILLQEATVLPTLRPDLFQGIRQPPRALLLFGPPGTGKTLLARAVATESRATFFPVTGSSVLSMWYGQSEQNVKALFEKARKRQPAIIFIDEVDSLLGKRSSSGQRDSTPDKRVTNEFLAFIDGIQTQTQQAAAAGGGGGGDSRVVVIAATNAPWDLDEAALSRFSRRIYVALPDRAAREALMRRAMEGIACDVSDEDWRRLAERCEKYSGRDLVQVSREAAMRPLRELWGRRLLDSSTSAAEYLADGGAAAGLPSIHAANNHHHHPSGSCSRPQWRLSAQQAAAAHQRLVDLVANSLAASSGCSNSSSSTCSTTTASVTARGSSGSSSATCSAARSDQKDSSVAAPGAGAGASASGSCGGESPRGWWRRWPWSPRGAPGFGGNWYIRSKKQARSELERWKRRHESSWCDVDAVMEQAERLLESKQKEQQQQHQGSCPQSTVQGPEGGRREIRVRLRVVPSAVRAKEPVTSPLTSAATAPDGVLATAATTVAAEGEVVEVVIEVVAPSWAPAAGNQAAAVGCDQATTTAATTTAATTTAATTTAATTAAAAAGNCPSAARQSDNRQGGGGSGATGPPAAASSSSPLGFDLPVASSSGGGGGLDGPALSLEGLLALPADKVRPVTAADLEAAIQIITCTEMDQTTRYTEWDEQYGSGATDSGRQAGGGRSKVWMSMYA